MSPDTRLRELADFIRVRRGHLSPQACGLVAGDRPRRTPGLRREELGRLAGLSADWIAWLEQGRDIKLSSQAAARLARALQLDPVEEEHLKALANGPGLVPLPLAQVPPTLRAVVEGQGINPAYVSDPLGDLVFWNASAGLVFHDFGRRGTSRANLLHYMFLCEEARSIADWEHYARRIAAKFRLWHDRLDGDARFAELALELRARSVAFNDFWIAHEVQRRSTGRKVIRHALGSLSFQYGSFQVEDAPELTVTILVPDPSGGATHAALQRALSDARVGAALPG